MAHTPPQLDKGTRGVKRTCTCTHTDSHLRYSVFFLLLLRNSMKIGWNNKASVIHLLLFFPSLLTAVLRMQTWYCHTQLIPYNVHTKLKKTIQFLFNCIIKCECDHLRAHTIAHFQLIWERWRKPEVVKLHCNSSSLARKKECDRQLFLIFDSTSLFFHLFLYCYVYISSLTFSLDSRFILMWTIVK